jgi:protein-disulfide isomerase
LTRSTLRRAIAIAAVAVILAGGGAWVGKKAVHAYIRAGVPQQAALHQAEIYRDGVSPVIGNPDGTVSVVVFTDYNCPYCREGEPAVVRLARNEPDIRMVMKELPLLGPDSVAVARLALAAKQQKRYWAFRQALFDERGHVDESRALRLAKSAGLDVDELKQDAASPTITKTLDDNRELADELGVPGVPFYMVGDQQIDEGPDLYQRLKAAVDAARGSDCGGDCSIHAGLD